MGSTTRVFFFACSATHVHKRRKILGCSLSLSLTHTLVLTTKNHSPETSPGMSSPAPGVSPVPNNSTSPPPVSSLTSPPPPDTTVSQAPPPTNSSGALVPPPPAAGSKAPSSPVLAALIVGVILGVLAGVGISVYVYRRKKRKEAQRLLLGGQPSQVASKGLPFLTLNCVEYKIMCICVFMLNLLRFLSYSLSAFN